MNSDYIMVELMHQKTMAGEEEASHPEYIRFLNSEAQRIYQTDKLNKNDIGELKKILEICNVFYNRTDMKVLPIEDGFYDLLLEKYKQYDPHFQVGSAVVNMKTNSENVYIKNEEIKYPISFFDKDNKDEIHQSIYDDLNCNGKIYLGPRDFIISPPVEMTSITKRTHNTEHNHPDLVGSLDKCKFILNRDAIEAGVFSDPNVKILERDFFFDHIKKGIITQNQKLDIVVELKYDGISVEADCTDRVLSARTRGDTGVGKAADITPILYQYPFPYADCLANKEPIGVKFEAIMTKSALYQFNQMRGKRYANCRTAIVGLFGASDAYLYRDLITLIPLAIDRDDVKAISNRQEEIEFLNRVFVSHGQPLRYAYFSGNIQELLYLISTFADEALKARSYLDFLFDGIVISYLDESIRAKLGRKNYINKYSMAVKFEAMEKETRFQGYTFEVGQNGNITPMIHYDPVEFIGTIHTKSSGASYARFNELALKPGDIISVKYVNDVMPYVSKVECEHNKNNPNPICEFPSTCPICGAPIMITESGKSATCPNLECKGRSIKRMTNMFAKLGIKGFAEATFIALDKTHFYELFMLSKEQLIEVLGEADGAGFYQALQALLQQPHYDFEILGSLGFAGLARKTWQAILSKVPFNQLIQDLDFCKGINDIVNVLNGYQIGQAAAMTIANEWAFFKPDVDFIANNLPLIQKVQTTSKMVIRFSGIRNLQLAEQLCNNGYDCDNDGSVTKNTNILLVPYIGFESGKVKKANAIPSCKVVAMDDFIENMESYLGEKIQ